jgi:Serine/threonine protein kinase
VPLPIRKERPVSTAAAPTFEAYVDDGSEPELEVDPGKFPLERYKPILLLGKGAAGSVYLCRDRLLGKKVAVKTLTELSPTQLIAFQLEAKATSKLTHPSIVTVMDFGATESGCPFMVMEYIDGISLEDLLQQTGGLSIYDALTIALKISLALSYVHGFHIFHRDIKPSNILLATNEKGQHDVWLIDFGVAHIKFESQTPNVYQGQTVVGSPAYMSPDQLKGLQYDDRSEVYSVGCVLFEMLTGRPPFVEQTAMETMSKHAHEAPPAISDLMKEEPPHQLVEVIEKCLEKSPDDRFQSMKALHAQLLSVKEAIIKESSRQDRTVTTFIKRKTNPILVWAAVAFIALAGVATLVVVNFVSTREQKPPEVTTERLNLPISMVNKSTPIVTHKINKAIAYITKTGYCELHGTITAHDFELLWTLEKKLTCIDATKADKVEWSGLEYFAGSMVKLLKFPLKARINDDDLKYVAMLDGQTSLKMAGSLINGSGLKYLAKMRIKELVIDWTKLTDPDAFKNISKMRGLRRLALNDSAGWSGDDIAPLKKLRLHELQISRTDLLDKGAVWVGQIKTLRVLGASSCGISDEGVKSLAGLNLRKLDINGNNIKADGILALCQMKTLRTLTITSVPTMKKAIRQLRESNPYLKADSSNVAEDLFLYENRSKFEELEKPLDVEGEQPDSSNADQDTY